MKPILVWLILCVLWGTTWIFIKTGLDSLPPVSFAAMRFVLAAIILLPVVLWQSGAMPKSRRDWILITATGILQFSINYGLLFWGEQRITSGLAAVLQASIPAFGLVLARIYIPSERITFLKVASILLGIGGIAIIFNDQLGFGGWPAFWGSFAVVAGAFAAAYASVLTKMYGSQMHPANMVFWQMLFGCVPLALVGLTTEGNPLNFNWTLSAAICVLYLAVMGSIVAFWLFYWLLRHMDISKAMMISLVTPLIAVVIGARYRNEELNWQAFFGGLLVLASVSLVVVRPLLDRRRSAVDG